MPAPAHHPTAVEAGTADIRPLMAGFPSGVSVLTALDEDAAPRGMTCSSLASVALSPPTLVVCVRTASPTLDTILAGGQFAVNLLHEDARDASQVFASGADDRFERVEWRLPLGAGGPHLTADAHATADCEVVRTVEMGDHTAVFAGVRRVTLRENAAPPLLYGRRRYARWSDAAVRPDPPAQPIPTEGAARVRP
ncbi:flavin reductase family protein [Streptomyces sp. NPDC101132]|uniref:flavin reductase family protein n=1 Tax=Streptomyces sp. NPDC101132 TaxID=3366110 RepID=UPI0037FE3490